MGFRSLKVLLGTSILALFVGQMEVNAKGANHYRYRDHNGSVVIGATIPPEFVAKGYEILNATGRVIEVVPPALTAEQIAVREAARAEAERQAKEDALLMRLYSTPEDAERARERRLQEIRGIISLKQGKIQALSAQIQEVSGQAANIERAGRQVPDEMLEKIQKLRSNVRDLQAEIGQNEQEIKGTERDFAAKIERLQQLVKKRAATTTTAAGGV